MPRIKVLLKLMIMYHVNVIEVVEFNIVVDEILELTLKVNFPILASLQLIDPRRYPKKFLGMFLRK